jgi:hypothetical protein
LTIIPGFVGRLANPPSNILGEEPAMLEVLVRFTTHSMPV